MVDITQAIGLFRKVFFNVSQYLFDAKIIINGVSVSIGAIFISGILLSFILSVFWKGAKQ